MGALPRGLVAERPLTQLERAARASISIRSCGQTMLGDDDEHRCVPRIERWDRDVVGSRWASTRPTSRIRFGPLVLNNDLRHPVVLAQEASALARWSGGRLELGLGAGYNRSEYERLGLAFAPLAVRAKRLAEAAMIIRALLAGETVTMEGEHYTVRDVSLGTSTQRVPLLIGGNSAEVLAVAAMHADYVGLVGYSPGTSTSDLARSGLELQIGRLRGFAGPRFAELELHVLVQWHEITSDRQAAAARAASELEASEEVALDSPYALFGTPEEIAEQLHGDARRFGISRWTIFGDRPGLAPAGAFKPVLELLADQPRSSG